MWVSLTSRHVQSEAVVVAYLCTSDRDVILP